MSFFKARTRPLLAALTEDVASLVTQLPITSIIELGRGLQPDWMKRSNYLRWDDSSYLLEYYSSSSSQVLSFDYLGQKWKLPQVKIFGDSVQLKTISLKTLSSSFLLDPELWAATEKTYRQYRRFLYFNGQKFSNGEILRVASIASTTTGWSMTVQPCGYKKYARSNLLLDARIGPGAKVLRDLVHPEGLPETSRLGDPLGINILLFTADGKAVLPLRTRSVMVRPRQFAPSVSGTVDWSDLGAASHTLADIHLLREGIEEMRIVSDNIVTDSIKVLGLTRELVRGGNPELFLWARTVLSESEIKALHLDAPDRWESTSPSQWIWWHVGSEAVTGSPNKYLVQRSFDDLLNKHGDRLSLPALTSLVLWLQHLNVF